MKSGVALAVEGLIARRRPALQMVFSAGVEGLVRWWLVDVVVVEIVVVVVVTDLVKRWSPR